MIRPITAVFLNVCDSLTTMIFSHGPQLVIGSRERERETDPRHRGMAYEFSSPSEQKNQKQKEKAEPIALNEEEEEDGEYDDDGEEEEEEEEEKEEGEVVQWQWRGDNLQWCPYPPAVSSVIEDAFRSQKSCVNFRLGPSSYTVHFEATGHRQVSPRISLTFSLWRSI
jgi:hypothetical protein